jgi:hypothetical protein
LPSDYKRGSDDQSINENYLIMMYKQICCSLSKHILKLLLMAFPESCLQQDQNEKTQLHHACLCNTPYSLEHVAVLLDVNINCLTVQDNTWNID